MSEFCFSKLKRKTSVDRFSSFCAQMRPNPETPVALLRAGLLLSLFSLRACLDDSCVLGIVGRPMSLPCVLPELVNSENVTIEWMRDSELVLRSVWKPDGSVETWSNNRVAVPADAPLTGNVSLNLPAVRPVEDQMSYSLFMVLGKNQSARLCTTCLRTAASFSTPKLEKEEAVQGDEKVFLCHSTGGYPTPAVYWLINDSEEPPAGSVRTQMTSLPDNLYNITSHLTLNISHDSIVSCIIDNQSMNQTVMSTYGVEARPVTNRASSAMWMFSTGLCVVVGIMVIAGVVYQIHLDKINKRKKEEHKQQWRGYKRRYQFRLEDELMNQEQRETDV
ncbi:T-lymphocyte activation antigen CD80 isoform X1 [Maylandia zebra]|uniref:T-lymphocyte activation antigen CD80 isoform X1 n=2 Tax=Maylandia zebra TaxID=106582 RepID=UPI000329AB27